ncbi:MAG TPA: hypothetical protein DDY58_15280 [Terrisporobacter glycolicus]|uniref:hypothetical protein n=1 Tax=Terrisporobacter TaxID=1505652 RepID=UPI000E96AEDC|nr:MULTISPECIES: hypothetical protein [Terrisporobacter]HBI93661.1 hypothetical protein [Terrisporobacter hibernicus]
MKKFKIEVCEKIELNHTYVVELPDNIYDEDVWNEIDKSSDGKDDVYTEVENVNGKIIEFIEDGSGDVQLEVIDVEEV